MTDRRARLLYPVYYEIMENGDRAQRVQKFLKDVDHHVSFLHTNPGIATDMLNIKIVDDETKTIEVNSFEDYRRIINQLISFQAYAGRLRDNMEACYLAISNPYESKIATNSLEEFYHARHVFIHGKKVPFGIDKDGLFKISNISIIK